MPRPFGRTNDGREEFERAKNPQVMDTWRDGGIVDHGLLYNAPTGAAPLQPHHFTMVESNQLTEAQLMNLKLKKQAEAENQNSGNAMILDNTGQSTESLNILTADDSSIPPAGDTGTITDDFIGSAGPAVYTGSSNGGGTCPKSDCLIWGLAGCLIGIYITKNGGA